MRERITQHEIILRYLKSIDGWLKSFNLRDVAGEWGFIGSQRDKRARELAKGQGYNPDGSLKKYFRRTTRGRCVLGVHPSYAIITPLLPIVYWGAPLKKSISHRIS